MLGGGWAWEVSAAWSTPADTSAPAAGATWAGAHVERQFSEEEEGDAGDMGRRRWSVADGPGDAPEDSGRFGGELLARRWLWRYWRRRVRWSAR